MTFIRAKEIPPHSGNWYDYEVMTVHVDGKVRQKVIQYIGKSGNVPKPHLIGNRSTYSKPKTDTVALPVVTCKHCQSQEVVKFGKQEGTQYYWCKQCQRKFVNNGAHTRMQVSSEK